MRHWSRNDKFAFWGVILAVISVASGVFGQEIRRGLGLDATQNQASMATPAPAARQLPPQAATASAGSSETIRVSGDANTITIEPSAVADGSQSYNVRADNGTSEFQLGPKQTAQVELAGDSNTVHIPPKLESRVTIVDSGDRNNVVH